MPQRLQQTEEVIERSVARLAVLKDQGLFRVADEQYRRREGPAAIDMIMDVVCDEFCNFTNTPPVVRRTKTPYSSIDHDELTLGEWEQV